MGGGEVGGCRGVVYDGLAAGCGPASFGVAAARPPARRSRVTWVVCHLS